MSQRAPFSKLIMASALLAPALLFAQSPVTDDTSLRFRSVFSDNMVLPYARHFALSGYASPGHALTLELAGTRYSALADARGRWTATVGPLAAGGPYAVTVRDEAGATASLENVLAGRLWLCSGQSNMAWSVSASTDQPEHMESGHDSIRLLTVAQRSDLLEQDEFGDANAWLPASDDSAGRFSAVCYFMARKLLEDEAARGEAPVPLGLVNVSWGGSAIEAWVSEATLGRVAGFDSRLALLQQYRSEQRAAELAFADDWMQWWQQNSAQGRVWEQGLYGDATEWRDAPLVNWKTYDDERLQNHHGLVWFSRGFELTAAQAAKGATLVLGKIDEVDSTWLNGRFVNNTFGYGTRRAYPLETGFLQPGRNQVTVNILNTWDAGGMTGPVDDVGIRFDDGEFLPLGEGWKYRFIPRETGYPPRSPWESVSGVTGMYNAMIAPLTALPFSGVLWYQGESNAESSGSYEALLQALVDDWRSRFAQTDLPFIVVQLPNYGPVASEPAESGWAAIRHAQQQVALRDPAVGLVVTHDSGDDADIHPRRKWVVGVRAAEVAQALAGKGGSADGVVARVAGRDGAQLQLVFEPPLATGLPGPLEGFAACSKGSCSSVRAMFREGGVQVDLAGQETADTLRFCWSDGGQCGLVAENGLPVSSFALPLVP